MVNNADKILIRFYGSATENSNDYDREIQNCIECEGKTRACNYCGILLNWLNGQPIEYQSGQRHICSVLRGERRRRYFSSRLTD